MTAQRRLLLRLHDCLPSLGRKVLHYSQIATIIVSLAENNSKPTYEVASINSFCTSDTTTVVVVTLKSSAESSVTGYLYVRVFVWMEFCDEQYRDTIRLLTVYDKAARIPVPAVRSYTRLRGRSNITTYI